MSLENQWQEGIRRISAAFDSLPEADRQKVRALCLGLMNAKETMQALAARVDASTHCAGCGGACCVTGKYHFTAVDLVAYLVTGESLFEPLFGNGLCPYLAGTGCLMPPGYRPFNCITFNCEKIEDLLQPEEVSEFYRLERALRESYAGIRSLFPGNSLDGSLLRG